MKLARRGGGKTVTPDPPTDLRTASPAALVQSMYDALLRQDLSRALGVLAPDLEVWQSETLPWGGTYRGHQGFADYTSSLMKHIDAALDIEAVLPTEGDKVVVTGRSRGRAWDSGKRFDAPFVHVWTAGPGGLTRLDVHVDTARILEALET